jgi:uncharacterized SAM-binding protein YcdF (DUF218 family)
MIRRVKAFTAGATGLLVVAVCGWVFAPQLLVVDSSARPADALVVLGGEPWTRPKRAAEVYQEVVAAALHGTGGDSRPSAVGFPLVLVSGKGDCEDVRRQLKEDGVPAGAIVTESESRSTWENARFSVKLLREKNVSNVIIVTSWAHSRRSLACFQKAAPEIHFFSRPTPRPPAGLRHPDSYTLGRVFQEYAKIAYYWVAYGIPPWV